MSNLEDHEVEPAHFELRLVGRMEVMDGDPRTLTLRVGRGNSSYLFPMTEAEALEFIQVLDTGLWESRRPWRVC